MIIGLAGKKQCGKDTCANALIDGDRNPHGGIAWKRIAFADPLREMCLLLNPNFCVPSGLAESEGWMSLVEVIDLVGWEVAKEEVPGVRLFIQQLGTDIVRTVDSDYWMNTARAAIEQATADGFDVVVTDARFPNEGELIYELGGAVIEIQREGVDTTDTHASEAGLPDWLIAGVVINDGTPGQLAASVLAGAIQALREIDGM